MANISKKVIVNIYKYDKIYVYGGYYEKQKK